VWIEGQIGRGGRPAGTSPTLSSGLIASRRLIALLLAGLGARGATERHRENQ